MRILLYDVSVAFFGRKIGLMIYERVFDSDYIQPGLNVHMYLQRNLAIEIQSINISRILREKDNTRIKRTIILLRNA